jgi:hypothetical protein
LTIVAAYGIGNDDDIHSIVMVADSRVTRTSPYSGKFVSRTDTGQKLLRIAPNIVVGLAGDYRVVQLIADVSKKIQKQTALKPLFTNHSDILMSIIGKYLKDSWVYKDTSLLFGLEDLQDGRRKIYLVEYPGFSPQRLGAGLHLIGSDEDTQKRFRKAFEAQMDFVRPTTLEEYAIPLWSAMGEVYGPEIGGSSGCYILTQGQCIPLNHALSPDGGEHWIANIMDTNGTIIRQVNGKTVARTTDKFEDVDRALSKPRGNI